MSVLPSLYMSCPVQRLMDFLECTNCQFVSVSKVDICLDFLKFDDGTQVSDFIARYMRGAYSKVNQSNVSAHGVDMWDGRIFNSMAWGSKSSPIFTRLYNKSLELSERGSAWRVKKPYIPLYWESCGLITHEELTTSLPNVWRLEFSIHSAVRGWTTITLDGNNDAKYSIRNLLSCYDDRGKCLAIFMALADHYFHFKRYIHGVRKDRCPDRVLFKWGEHETVKPFVSDNTSDSSKHTPDYAFLRSLYFSVLKCICDYNLPSSFSLERELSKLLSAQYASVPSSFNVSNTFHTLHVSTDVRRS